jgi:hypothetical protein
MDEHESQQDPVKPSGLSLRYNLEKEPLQTGRRGPDVTLRERAATALGQWYVRRRIAGWIAALLVALLGAGGIAAALASGGFWNWLVNLYRRLAHE